MAVSSTSSQTVPAASRLRGEGDTKRRPCSPLARSESPTSESKTGLKGGESSAGTVQKKLINKYKNSDESTSQENDDIRRKKAQKIRAPLPVTGVDPCARLLSSRSLPIQLEQDQRSSRFRDRGRRGGGGEWVLNIMMEPVLKPASPASPGADRIGWVSRCVQRASPELEPRASSLCNGDPTCRDPLCC